MHGGRREKGERRREKGEGRRKEERRLRKSSGHVPLMSNIHFLHGRGREDMHTYTYVRRRTFPWPFYYNMLSNTQNTTPSRLVAPFPYREIYQPHPCSYS